MSHDCIEDTYSLHQTSNVNQFGSLVHRHWLNLVVAVTMIHLKPWVYHRIIQISYITYNACHVVMSVVTCHITTYTCKVSAAISGSEDFLLQGPPDAVVEIFLAAFATAEYNTKNADARKQQKGDGPGDENKCDESVTDELALDEQQMYKQKVTKWISGALTCLQDHMFWFLMAANFQARGPVRHLFAILAKYGKHSERSKPCTTRQLPIVNFITERIDQIKSEFASLRDTVGFWTKDIISNIRKMSRWFPDASLDSTTLQSVALKLVIYNHTAYVRRIVTPFTSLHDSNNSGCFSLGFVSN